MFVNINNSYMSTHGIESELRHANKLKEKQLKQQELHNKRKEWIEMLRRSTDDAILKMLDDTEEYITYIPQIRGGNVVLYELPEVSEVNNDYIDIKNECIIRGLIK